MKTIYQKSSIKSFAFFTTLVLLTIAGNSCEDKCKVEQSYNYYEPVYTTTAEIRAAVKTIAPQEINEPGKIYIKDNWLFLNEVGKGIHVIDNKNPSNPTEKTFINIPGNYDLSVKGNILYADSYIDLLAIDISDVQNIKVVKRLEGIFSRYNSLGFAPDVQKGIVTEWALKEKVNIDDSGCRALAYQQWGGVYYDRGVALMASSSFSSKAAVAPNNAAGKGGSMSRFTIEGDHLYLLDNGNLQTVDIKITSEPKALTKAYISWDIETVFPYNGNLFLGSQTGMYIFSLSDPENPKQLSLYSHVRQCDPVVVEGDLAYVTLRSGNACQGFSNQLEVIDVKDLKNPVLLKTYLMTNPHGLGIDNKTLFICDGDDGLKVFDASDYKTISANQLAHYKNINTYDVIPYNNVAIMTGKDGIYQFDYSDVKNIKLISTLQIIRKQ
jgi:hypothetical protein